MVQALGRQILAEFYGCNPDILDDTELIKRILRNAALKSNATIVNSTFHHFSPYGVSGVVVIAESHISIHTWPEYGYAAVDIFTCGDSIDPWVAFKYLERELGAESSSAMELRRGIFDLERELVHKPETRTASAR